jgi:high-affinity Fe2+/Pb2+ permease
MPDEPSDEGPGASELYSAVREQIRHENEVVNHRLGWFLAAEGFLVAAFVTGVGLYNTLAGYRWAWIFVTFGLLAIAVLGMLLAISTHRTVSWAF